MIERKPYFFQPDDYYDCGELGEHPVQFTAWVRYLDAETRPLVTITAAQILATFGRHAQLIDLLPKLQADAGEMLKWQLAITRDYLKAREREDERECV